MAPHHDLIEAARTQTGLDDFGDDSFREGLERLVRSLHAEARLHTAGQETLRGLIVNLLAQRLQVEDWYRRHPEIDDEPVERPLIGLGLPRTGSTALSFLLAEDPGARSLSRWEAEKPCPPPSTVSGSDARIERSRAVVEREKREEKRRRALVPASATGPTECLSLLALDFKSQMFQGLALVPSYSSWLLHEADLTSAYRYERRVLKLLQWGRPPRPWRLKSPAHLLFLDHLDRAFPDARFVMTHRDPTEVIVSAADLCAEITRRYSDDVDPHYLGALNVEHWSVGMERALAFRDRDTGGRFHDIDFRAMQSDPIGEVRRLYAWLGEPVTEAFETGMDRWWQENAARREPNVHPEPAAFGIDPDRVRPLFAGYTARAARWTAR
ncbi:sulfotransferase family protein [Actinomadura rugatobispora]|uniref:Sulfotransferase family protein n=1 Tax=Actinomadura rugatobispora TaxID=1994 RepID=A0ABW0ZTY1_9ACTN|nr:sulfotransferase [Actinomadura rugatobispora]